MSDCIFDNLGWVIVFFVAFLLVVAAAASKQEAEQRTAFMAQCLQDHKEYECQALWGQARGNRSNNDMATGLAIGIAAGAAGRR